MWTGPHRVGDVLKVGLTGGIGSGKSAVAGFLQRLGAVLIDADVIAREVVAPGTPGLDRIVAEFGGEVLTADGELDRQALADRVFSDEPARHRLGEIVHPLVGRRSQEIIASLPDSTVVVHDVPLLVENDLAPGYDLVVVVEAPEADRVARLVAERGMTEEAVRARMAAQASDARRREVADVVLVNDGTLEDLQAMVEQVWRTRIEPLAAARRPGARTDHQ